MNFIKARPDYSILSEETGKIKKDESFKWIIDPYRWNFKFFTWYTSFCNINRLEQKKKLSVELFMIQLKMKCFC